jgi:5-methyltetrahydrofolate--homocysteine methyltransferase
MSKFEKLANLVYQGDLEGVNGLTLELISDGADPLQIINDGLIAGMNIVAPKFKAGEMYVPEVMMSARAMADGIALVKPLINDEDIPTSGTVVIATVEGDLHDIGKNLVLMILESGGFKVIDLGVDVSPEKFVVAVKEHKPHIIALSALLTTTMMTMKTTIDALVEAGVRDQVKVIVGGAPVSKSFAEDIGADGYGPDAMAAKDLAVQLLQ